MILSGDTPIFIHRRTQVALDEYGNPTYTTEEILVRNVLIGWGGSQEPQEVARDAIDASLTLYLPPQTQVLDGDIFEIRETMWEKDGDPQEWDAVNGFEVGVVVKVRRRRG